jgi:hypothetical protein
MMDVAVVGLGRRVYVLGRFLRGPFIRSIRLAGLGWKHKSACLVFLQFLHFSQKNSALCHLSHLNFNHTVPAC